MKTNNSEFLIEDGILKEYRGNEKNVVIPYGATIIGKKAFEYANVESVLIPNSVTKIEEEAFQFCHSLAEITFPNSIEKVGYDAFYECWSLKAVHISDLTSWCNIDFGDSYKNPLYYANDLYLNGELIKKLVIPNDVLIIKSSSFEGSSISEIVIPDSVTDIEEYAFHCCDSLESVIIPNSVTVLGKGAFASCDLLSKVVIKGEINSVNDPIFNYCKNLKELYVCSEKLKSEFKIQGVPKNCQIIVDKTLNKDKSITLGSDYLSDASVNSSGNKSDTSRKKSRKNNHIIKGDEL